MYIYIYIYIYVHIINIQYVDSVLPQVAPAVLGLVRRCACDSAQSEAAAKAPSHAIQQQERIKQNNQTYKTI